MHRVTTSMRKLRSDDEGIAFVFVAVLAVALLGMVAFAIDVGALYQERRELQNGADAAVLAIAEDCGRGLGCDSSTADGGTAQTYVDANAADKAADIESLDLDLAAQTIEIVARTETSGGGSILKPFFAQVIGFDGSNVKARSKAAFGAIGGGKTLPIIFSDCEWEKFKTDLDTDDDSPAGQEIRTIYFHGDNDPKGKGKAKEGSADCHHSPSGQDLPGGFGWLEENIPLDEDPKKFVPCLTKSSQDGWVGVDPGASPTQGCDPDVFEAEILGNDVVIPYFWSVTLNGVPVTDGETLKKNTGSNAEYKIRNYSLLHVTGYNFGGQFKASKDGGPPPCKGEMRCIEGYFKNGSVTGGEIDLDAEYRGVLIVKFIR